MSSNSAIFTSSIFGNSSGLTAQDQANKNRQTQEKYLATNSYSRIRTQLPQIPSNQGKAKE